MWKSPFAGPRGPTAIRGVPQPRWQTMSKLIDDASATATIAAAVLLPLLVTLLLNDGSLLPLLVLLVMLPQLHSGSSRCC